MGFNTGLIKSNKQTKINAFFTNNLKKGRRKVLNSSSLQYPDIRLRNSAALVI